MRPTMYRSTGSAPYLVNGKVMSQSQPIRVLIVDDDPLARAGTDFYLSSFADVAVVGMAESAEAAIEACAQGTPDIVLMDMHMPRMAALGLTQELRRRLPGVRVILLAHSPDDTAVERAFQVGASGYLLKSVSPLDLAQAIRTVMGGRVVVAPEMVHSLWRSAQAPPRPMLLSERELEILRLVARGKTNTYVAEQLHIARATVKYHLRNICDKLEVDNRVAAVAKALSLGLIEETGDASQEREVGR